MANGQATLANFAYIYESGARPYWSSKRNPEEVINLPNTVDVNLDADEMVVTLERDSAPRTIEYSKLDRLVRAKEEVRKLFKNVEVKSIHLHVRGMEEPIVIASNRVRDFERVEKYLLEVAEKRDIAVG